jgi:hypothetical protein
MKKAAILLLVLSAIPAIAGPGRILREIEREKIAKTNAVAAAKMHWHIEEIVTTNEVVEATTNRYEVYSTNGSGRVKIDWVSEVRTNRKSVVKNEMRRNNTAKPAKPAKPDKGESHER